VSAEPAGAGAAAGDLADAIGEELDGMLADADAEFAARYPGAAVAHQPVQTAYVPAHLVDDGTPRRWGEAAAELLDEHADPAVLADLIGLTTGLTDALPDLLDEVLVRLRAKLTSQPIEDLRIDFEDGYGRRDDAAEDADAVRAAATLRRLVASPQAPIRCGIRMKGLQPSTRRRGLRTLATVLAAVAGENLPGLVTTLPKVTSVAQIEAFVHAAARLEQALGLPAGSVRFEIQIETPQAVLAADGTATVAAMLHRSQGRCIGLHYGTYDYSAELGIPPAQQRLDHPVADHAKAVMQLAAAGTAVAVCDGSSNVLPVGERDHVLAAWRLHAHLVRRSLERGYYQGWDLHPGQLVTRYLTTYAGRRLRSYLDLNAAASTGQQGAELDEPATAAALSAAVLRAVDCGAVDPQEAAAAAGTTLDQLALLARRPPPTSEK
jgi:hypothetical protein